MLVVHHLNNSRSQRVLWTLEELGVEYELKRYQRDPKTMLAPPELRQVHPLGKSPVVSIEGEAKEEALVLAESGAILEYLVDRYGNGRFAPPAGTSPERVRFNFWMHYAEGSVMPPLLLKLVSGRIASAPAPFFVRPIAKKIASTLDQSFITPQLDTHFDFIDRELAKTGWFVGSDFTIADAQMSFPLEAGAQRGGAGKRPNIRAFLDKIHARPAYRRALERGGRYDLA